VRPARLIGLRITWRAFKGIEETLKIKDLPGRWNIEMFNPSHANVFAVVTDDYEGEVKIGFTHPEFRLLSDAELVPEYSLAEMRCAFPYLFDLKEPTNPILWRNFGKGSSK